MRGVRQSRNPLKNKNEIVHCVACRGLHPKGESNDDRHSGAGRNPEPAVLSCAIPGPRHAPG